MVNKKGSALLTALFIMTLVAIAATAMSTRLQLDIYRTRMTITSDKLYLASQAVPFWAMGVLSQKKFKNPFPKYIDFPSDLENLYPNIQTQGRLIDLQSRFNLNNLRDKKYQIIFHRLLGFLEPNLDTKQRASLVKAIENWVSYYQPQRGYDPFLQYYLQQKPPYQAAHLPLKSPSELRLIKGISAKLYNTLSPYITVLPDITPVNINTASLPIIMSLGNGIEENKAIELISKISTEEIQNPIKLNQILKKYDIPASEVTLESQYYLCQAVSQSNQLSLTNFTLLKRMKDKKGNIKVTVEVESLNTL